MLRKTILASAALAALGFAWTTAPRVAELRAQPAGLETLRFDHVSIHVADFERSRVWYREKLGFREDVTWRVAALGGKQLAYLSRNGARIELVSAGAAGPSLPPAADFAEHFAARGFGHLCFEVADIDAAMAELAQNGVPAFVAAATYPLDGTPYERRVAFIKDPDGNIIEFAGPLTRRP